MDDARPDRWGERVIRFIDKPPRLSLLEYLYFRVMTASVPWGSRVSRGISAASSGCVAYPG